MQKDLDTAAGLPSAQQKVSRIFVLLPWNLGMTLNIQFFASK